MRALALTLAATLSIAAASATRADIVTVGFQEIETFEGRALGATNLTVGLAFGNFVSGGTVVLGVPANPARSGDQVYGGFSLQVLVEDVIDYSWPAIGGYVTGDGEITLRAFDYDPDTGLEEELPSVSVFGGGPHYFLSIGSEAEPRFITRAVFSSASYFTLDDLTLGLPTVGPGIPEPATWAVLITGFALTGGALRRRRAAITA